MADLRIPLAGTALVPQARQTPARADAVRAAQRAFFEAALNDATPMPAEARSASAPAQGMSPATAVNRMMRPGSLVDIKV